MFILCLGLIISESINAQVPIGNFNRPGSWSAWNFQNQRNPITSNNNFRNPNSLISSSPTTNPNQNNMNTMNTINNNNRNTRQDQNNVRVPISCQRECQPISDSIKSCPAFAQPQDLEQVNCFFFGLK